MVRLTRFWRRTVYVHHRVDEYRRYWRAAAESLEAEFVELSDQIWEVRRGSTRTRIANDLVALDDPATLAVAGDKALCYRIASDLGVPVPQHRVLSVRRFADAARWIAGDGHPFVVKPRRNTSSGIGVTVGVQSRAGAMLAFTRAAVRDGEIIVERMVGGETYRLLFLSGELIHAVRRAGVRVTGDGSTSIANLLAASGHAAMAHDRATRLTLGAQDLSLRYVPAAKATVVVRTLPPGETSTVGLRTAYDEVVTDLIAPRLASEVSAVVAAVGTEWAGVDIITSDPSRPLDESGGVFLEINTTPGLHHHCKSAVGTSPCFVAVRVLQHALDKSAAQTRW